MKLVDLYLVKFWVVFKIVIYKMMKFDKIIYMYKILKI